MISPRSNSNFVLFCSMRLTEYVDRVIAFTAHGQNFDHFTASGSFLSNATRRKIFTVNFFFTTND